MVDRQGGNILQGQETGWAKFQWRGNESSKCGVACHLARPGHVNQIKVPVSQTNSLLPPSPQVSSTPQSSWLENEQRELPPFNLLVTPAKPFKAILSSSQAPHSRPQSLVSPPSGIPPSNLNHHPLFPSWSPCLLRDPFQSILQTASQVIFQNISPLLNHPPPHGSLHSTG